MPVSTAATEFGPAATSRSKRYLDIVVATVGLLVTAPLLAAIAVVVRFGHGAPVLFRQRRGGLGGEPFEIFKFRTMRDERYPGEPDSERVTRVGRVLRRTSLDELPELVNVVRGDMSLVGPRPLHVRYNDRYDERQAGRLAARPGMTGLAQTGGRDSLGWDERFQLDLEYLTHWSMAADLRILVHTARLVLDPAHRAQVEQHTDIAEFGIS